MADEPAASPSPAEKAEQAKIRRRWLTLGEAVAVIAVAISGLTLWNNWSERREVAAERAADARKADRIAAQLTLRAIVGNGGEQLDLKPSREDQAIQSQTVSFPPGLGVSPVETAGEPRIEARWFDDAVKKARKAAGREADRGDARLPVAIATRFTTPGGLHEDVAIYDIGYAVERGGLLGGSEVKLRGLSLVGAVRPDDAPARLKALWAKRMPAK